MYPFSSITLVNVHEVVNNNKKGGLTNIVIQLHFQQI